MLWKPKPAAKGIYTYLSNIHSCCRNNWKRTATFDSTMMEQRLSIVTLGVADLKTATEFYETKLGWQKQTSSRTDNISFFQLNGIILSLFPKKELALDAGVSVDEESLLPTSSSKDFFKGFTLAHNCRSKEEVNQIMGDLQTKGVNIVKKPKEVFWGGYSGYFSDPGKWHSIPSWRRIQKATQLMATRKRASSHI